MVKLEYQIVPSWGKKNRHDLRIDWLSSIDAHNKGVFVYVQERASAWVLMCVWGDSWVYKDKKDNHESPSFVNTTTPLWVFLIAINMATFMKTARTIRCIVSLWQMFRNWHNKAGNRFSSAGNGVLSEVPGGHLMVYVGGEGRLRRFLMHGT